MPISRTAASSTALTPSSQGNAAPPRNLLLSPPPGAPPPQAMTPAGPQGAQPNMLLGAGGGAAPQQAQPQANPLTAAVAAHLQSLPPAKLKQEAARANYLVHSFGMLARKPNLTFKDVISQAGQAVADGKATPEEAMQEVMHMPQNPAALQAAVQQRFKAAIIAAALLSGDKGAPGPQQGASPPALAAPAAPPPNLTQGVLS